MAKTDCESILNLIPLYIDNMLPDAEDDIVLAHLRDCPACREEYDFLKAILEDAATLPKVEVSADFHKNLMEKVKAENVAAVKTETATVAVTASAEKAASETEPNAEEKPGLKPKHTLRRVFLNFAAAAAIVAVSVVSFLNMGDDLQTESPDAFVKTPATVESPTDIGEGKEAEEAEQSEEPKEATPTEAPTDDKPAATGSMAPLAEASQTPDGTAQTMTPGGTDGQTAQPTTPAAGVTPPTAAPATGNDASVTHEPQSDTDAQHLPATAQAGGRSSGGGGRGGSGAGANNLPAIVKGHTYRITLSQQAKEEAAELLKDVPKEENGYRIDAEHTDIIMALSHLEGFTITEEENHTDASYLVIEE